MQAVYDLATLYRNGAGVPKDEAKAAALLAKAADAGHSAAQVEYAVMLANGKGVTKNEAEAVKFLRMAAERGNPVAQNRLARAYSAGFGIAPDRIEACKWHLVARAAGEADLKLDLLLMALKPEERKKAETLAQAWRDAQGEATR
jgi:uncharacterized protein